MSNKDFIIRTATILAALMLLVLTGGIFHGKSEDPNKEAREITAKIEREAEIVEIFKLGIAAAYSESEVSTLLGNCRDPHTFRLALALMHQNRAGLNQGNNNPASQDTAKAFMKARDAILAKVKK